MTSVCQGLQATSGSIVAMVVLAMPVPRHYAHRHGTLSYPFYHTAYDTPDKLSYRALADIVVGLRQAVASLADVVGGRDISSAYPKH